MPFDTENNSQVIFDRPERDVPIEGQVTTREVLGATFQNDHSVVNLANDIGDYAFSTVIEDDEYDAVDDLEGYEQYADDLIFSVSREDMTRRKQRIDDELAAKETIAQATGMQALGSGILTAITDPLSWIPIGGPAFKTYRTGGKILEGAGRTAATAAIIETGREAYLQQSQVSRSAEESISNIASVTLLSGLMGGAASTLSPASRADIAAKIESDLEIPQVNTGLSSVGAAQVATTTAEQEAIKGLGKTKKALGVTPDVLTSPVLRGSLSESKAMREITEQLADTSLVKNKNTEFIASATSVENKIKAYDSLKLNFYRDFNPQYRAYRKRVSELKKGDGIPVGERIGGRKDGTLTWREFSSEVTKAGRRNDVHAIPEVQNVAQSVRRNVYDPLKARMVETGLLDDLDIEVKTADSWVRRMWDKNRILADREAFKKINVDWLKKKRDQRLAKLDEFENRFKGEIKAKDKNILKELDDLKFKASQLDEEIDDVADQLIDQIVGLPGGRLGYDIKMQPKNSGFKKKIGARGSAKQRVYDIPDDFVEDYLVNDVHAIVESHTRTTAADAELIDTFGSLDFDVVKKQVQEDYQGLLAAARKNPKKTKKLEAAKRKDLADLEAMWEKLRGIYAQPDDYAAPQHIAERGLLAWNYARLLGGMTLSAVPDMGRNVMVHGVGRTMNDGVLAMISDFKGFKGAAQDVREAAVGLDMALSTTARARANIDEFTPVTGKIDAASQTVAQNFGNVALMNQWNTAQKTFAGVLTQTRMMKAIRDFGDGKKISTKEIENLASHGIGAEEAKKIAKQFKKHGENTQRVLIPNARSWDDVASANLFRSAVRKQVDEIIVTPGLDRPLWMSRPGWRMVGQFRSFAFASMQRVTLAGLQQGDAAALNGVLMMIGMGAMVYGAKQKLAGRPVSDDPQVWITEGIDRSGITGWMFDVNNITEKATRGTVGMNALIGGPQMSRYASRNVTGAILGPSLGLSADFFTSMGAAASGEWTESDTHAMRRLMPYQNVLYLRTLFDQVEKGVNHNLGVQ